MTETTEDHSGMKSTTEIRLIAPKQDWIGLAKVNGIHFRVGSKSRERFTVEDREALVHVSLEDFTDLSPFCHECL